jgi:hypothetical protein
MATKGSMVNGTGLQGTTEPNLTNSVNHTEKPLSLQISQTKTLRVLGQKLDLSNAHIYQYILKFSPEPYFSRKEKKHLALSFLTLCGLKPNSSDVVVGEKL